MSRPRRRAGPTPLPERVAVFIERFSVRVVLSLAILASLVPHRYEATTDLVFLVLFGVELALRVISLARGVSADDSKVKVAKQRLRSALLLTFDVVALLTFVPSVAEVLGDAGWLRLLRFARLLLVIAYWSPLFRAGFEVMRRQDRWRQIAMLGLVTTLVAFAGAALLVHISVDTIDFDGSGVIDGGDRSFAARFWWSLRQLADGGNLMADPNEIAVVVVSIMLTVGGLVFMSFLIGLATDIVKDLVIAAGNRPPGWHGHTVVVNTTPGLPRLLAELGAHYERLFRRPRFIVADPLSEPPDGFRDTSLPRFLWRGIDPRGTELADKTDLSRARRVVVLASPQSPFPDAHLAATVLNAREANARAWIVAEVLDPGNVAATAVAGGARTVVVSTERMLALWAVAAIRRPDQLALAHELVVSRAGREIYTCYTDVDGLEGSGQPWHTGAMTFADIVRFALARGGRVMPIGVVRGGSPGAAPEQGELILNPPPDLPLVPPLRALVAVADHFDAVQDLTLELAASAPSFVPRSEPPPSPPELRPLIDAASHRKVLVCGFRPATVDLCAALLAHHPACELTLVQRHEESVRVAEQALLEHGTGSAYHVLSSARPRRDGRFERAGDDAFAWIPDGAEGTVRVASARPRLRLVRADWSSDRTLQGLDPNIDHVASYDLVVLLGAHDPDYDGRTAIAVLKIADLARAEPSRFASDFAVLAGVADTELGRRLAEGFQRTARRPIHVIDTEELRALMVFQAIAVPGYGGLFDALIGPGDQGFMRFTLAQPRDRQWTFGELARALVTEHVVLIAVDLEDGRRVHLADASFSERDIVELWTLHDEARA